MWRFLLALLVLSGSAAFLSRRGNALVVDATGNPVAGASVWVTYFSATHPPEFITDSHGFAKLRVKNLDNAYSIVSGKDGMGGYVSKEQITWPLRITIR